MSTLSERLRILPTVWNVTIFVGNKGLVTKRALHKTVTIFSAKLLCYFSLQCELHPGYPLIGLVRFCGDTPFLTKRGYF